MSDAIMAILAQALKAVSPEYIEELKGVEERNPYLAAALMIKALCARMPAPMGWMMESRVREPFAMRYSWAIPNPAALDCLVKHSPIVEIGAGTGYWASLATRAGADVIAFDRALPGPENRFHPTASSLCFDVKPGGPEDAARFPERTLFLCWPPQDNDMAYEALECYRGNTLLFAGEHDGCTGSAAFFDLLAKEWESAETVGLPQWDGSHDNLTVYHRRSS